MNRQPDNVRELSPRDRQISRELSKSVFDRTYMTILLIGALFMGIMGFTVSQMYEMSKDFKSLQEDYKLNTLVRMKQEAKNNE